MDAKKLYCRKASEFNLFKDFNSEDFKFIKFVIEHEDLLISPGKDFVNLALIHDFRLHYDEEHRGPGGAVLYNYLESVITKFMKDNEGTNALNRWRRKPTKQMKEEELTIYHILEEKGFIRKNGISESILIAAIVNGVLPVEMENGIWINPDLAGYTKEHLDDYYETIKSVTDKELDLIIGVLREELTPNQYEVVIHYILKGWRKHYIYTSTEYEALLAGFKNIQNELKHQINKIMDHTLF